MEFFNGIYFSRGKGTNLEKKEILEICNSFIILENCDNLLKRKSYQDKFLRCLTIIIFSSFFVLTYSDPNS